MKIRILTLFTFILSGAVHADESAALHDLFAREWAYRLAEFPLLATSVGVHQHNHELPSVGAADQQRRRNAWLGYLAELSAIDRGSLAPSDQVNYDIFRQQIEALAAEIELRSYEMPFNADSGFHMSFARLPVDVPLSTSADYQNYLARLEKFPHYMAQQISNMRAGIDRNFVQPRIVLQGYEATVAAHVVDDPAASVFFAPFETLPDYFSEREREQLLQRAHAAISAGVIPAYADLFDFLVDEYIPQTRQDIAATGLPNGRAYYAQQIRHFTTLDLSAEEIHQLGLGEVARIRREMLEVIEQIGFVGGFDAFVRHLRTDPAFYPQTEQELLRFAAYIGKKMDARLPQLFRTLPRLPYGVEPVPAAIAPKYTTGRYVSAPYGSTRAGTYWVNVHALNMRPLYNMEALTLHEAVPGHHIQIALANEIDDLPDFRRFSYLSAFGEGWGLYAEWLGLEVGFYADPYSNFGRLSYEMWRACRLVVDTGMHAFGWSRERALDYMAANTALSLHNVETEIDRYISWPAQALAYKIGEMKIKSLRKEAEHRLGARFDVRDFHDAVLLQGSVPLPVLETQIEAWIESFTADN